MELLRSLLLLLPLASFGALLHHCPGHEGTVEFRQGLKAEINHNAVVWDKGWHVPMALRSTFSLASRDAWQLCTRWWPSTKATHAWCKVVPPLAGPFLSRCVE